MNSTLVPGSVDSISRGCPRWMSVDVALAILLQPDGEIPVVGLRDRDHPQLQSRCGGEVFSTSGVT